MHYNIIRIVWMLSVKYTICFNEFGFFFKLMCWFMDPSKLENWGVYFISYYTYTLKWDNKEEEIAIMINVEYH